VALARARKLGASYAESDQPLSSRIDLHREERVQNVSRTQSFGFGVRVLVKGAWGFAASPLVTPEVVGESRQAVEIARANAAYQRKPIKLATTPRAVANWRSNFRRPF